MKLIKMCVATLAVALFAGTAAANTDELYKDMINGSNIYNSNPSQPYSRSADNPRDDRDNVIDMVDSVTPGNSDVPFKHGNESRDNSHDLIDTLS